MCLNFKIYEIVHLKWGKKNKKKTFHHISYTLRRATTTSPFPDHWEARSAT